MALDRWVRDGVEPPASKYPRLADGTLTTIDALKWPALKHPVTEVDSRTAPRSADGAIRRMAVPRSASR